MKKQFIFFLSVFALMSLNPTFAQFELGVVGGINIASFNVQNEEDEITSRTLWNVGLVGEYKINHHFSIKAEPMYIKKGGILSESNNNPELVFKQSFIEVPIMLKFSLGEKNKAFLNAGPSVGIILTSELEADIDGIIFNADLKDLTESLDLGFCMGGGFSFNVFSGTLFLEGKYTFGFTNLAKNGTFIAKAGHLELEGELEEKENNFKSRGLQLSIGYSVPL